MFAVPQVSLFSKLFLTLIALIVMPVAGLSALGFHVMRENLEREVTRSHLDILYQTRQAVDSMLEDTALIAAEVAYHPGTVEFIRREWRYNIYKDIRLFREMMTLHDMTIAGSHYLESISVYSLVNAKMVTTGTGIIRSPNPEAVDILFARARETGSLWLEPGDSVIPYSNNDFVSYVRIIYGEDARPAGFVIMRLMSKAFNALINHIYLRETGYVTLVDMEGRSVFGDSRGDGILQALFSHREPMEWTGNTGRLELGGRQMLVSFTDSRFNGWRYLAALPADELDSGLTALARMVFGVCGALVILLGGLSFLFSRRIYNPIKFISDFLTGERDKPEPIPAKLQKRGDELGLILAEAENILGLLRDERVRSSDVEFRSKNLQLQLMENVGKLQGHLIYELLFADTAEQSELARRAALLGIPATPQYIVLLVDFDQSYQSLLVGPNLTRSDVLKNGLIELLESFFSRETLPVKLFFETDLRVVAILGLEDKGAGEGLSALRQLCRLVQNYLQSKLSFTVTIAAGRPCGELSGIRRSYGESVSCLKRKFLSGDNSLIFYDDISGAGFRFDTAEQRKYRRRIVRALQSADMEELRHLLRAYLESTVFGGLIDQSYTFYCRDLVNILQEFAIDAGYNNPAHLERLNSMFFHVDREFRSIGQTVDDLCTIAADMTEDLADPERSSLICRAVKLVHENYGRDIGLGFVADELRITESYLSRLFKQKLGKTFKEYLTDYRMDTAKRLMWETDLPIQEISARIGYNNHNQFSKIFRVREGVSPSRFRANYQEEGREGA